MLSHTLKSKHAMGTLFALNFLLGAHIALIVYFNASFLESRGISESWLGAIFMAGSVVSIFVYYLLPIVLKRFGAYRFLLIATLIELFLFIGLGSSSHIPTILALFVSSLGISVALSYCLDIFLEAHTKSEADTGPSRSSFLTVLNLAYVISPLLAGLILKYYGFAELYILAALLLVPFIFLLNKTFKTFKDPLYQKLSLLPAFKEIRANKNLYNIFIVQFLIRFFFSWMVIYTPIYLHQHIGFSLAQTGLMFSLMLLPFVLLEYPLGHYIDKLYGEKEFLILGFVILSGATYYLSFITTANFLLWAALLFATRVGAAIIEVMNEIYFFKQVKSTDTDTLSAFRMVSPVAYIIGPGLGSLLLFLLPMQYLFCILAIIMLTGIVVSTQLRDTK